MDEVIALQHDAARSAARGRLWRRTADARPNSRPRNRQPVARSWREASLGLQARRVCGSVPAGEVARPTLRRVLAGLLVHFPVYRTYGSGGALSPADHTVTAGRRPTGRAGLAGLTDRWAVDAVLGLFAGARRHGRHGALSAVERARRRQGGRGHGLLSLRPAALAQRCRLRRGNFSASMPRLPRPGRARRRRIRPIRCWRRPRTTTSAARTCARASRALSSLPDEWAALRLRRLEAARPPAPTAPRAGDRRHAAADPGRRLAVRSRSRRPCRPPDFADRLAAWQEKALREAKLFTDWAASMRPRKGPRAVHPGLVAAGRPPIAGGYGGVRRRIARSAPSTALRQMPCSGSPSPACPTYQGTELWDFSLVDPDNRRPVDFVARASALRDGGYLRPGQNVARRPPQAGLDRARPRAAPARAGPVGRGQLSARPGAGRTGRVDDRLRTPPADREQWLLAAVPRLPLALLQGEDGIGIAPEAWRGTTLHLELVLTRPVIDVLTGAPVGSLDGSVPLARLCTTLPFVLLTTQG